MSRTTRAAWWDRLVLLLIASPFLAVGGWIGRPVIGAVFASTAAVLVLVVVGLCALILS